jgi:hypothetical protein
LTIDRQGGRRDGQRVTDWSFDVNTTSAAPVLIPPADDTRFQGRERRRFQRFTSVFVQGRIARRTPVEIGDIGLGGLSLSSHKRLTINDSYPILLRHDRGEFRLTGRVVWCRLAATHRIGAGEVVPRYRAGLKFESAFADQMEELFDLVERIAALMPTPSVAW